MKPYEIEIFDRQFNFRCTALVDQKDFSFKYDMLSPEKNTLNFSQDITVRLTATAGSAGDMSICTGDYIRIMTDNYEFTGVITNIIKNKTYTEITYMDVLYLFDHEVYVAVDDIKLSYIEDYLFNLLTAEFITTDDLSQKIYGLNITNSSQTVGVFDYCNTNDTYTIINLLDDIISPAYKDFLIKTTASIDFGNKAINVTIGKINESNIKTIEGDLPNINAANYVIRKSIDDHNKLVLIDTYNNTNTRYNFYLHASDYSFNQTNNDRITPVVNDIEEFNSSIITEESYWKRYDEPLKVINTLLEKEETLTSGEISALSSAFDSILPLCKTYFSSLLNEPLYRDAIVPDLRSEAWEHGVTSGDINQGYSTNRPYFYHDVNDETLTTSIDGSFCNFNIHFNSYATTISQYNCKAELEDYSRWDFTSRGDSFYNTFFYGTNGSIFGGQKKSHISLTLPFNFDVHASHASRWVETETGIRLEWAITYCWGMAGIIQKNVTKSDITSAINAYKQTAEYQEAYNQYKTEKFQDLLTAYANKVFKASKYTNLIELTVKADDTMINPLSMNIGQVVEIIHDGVTYNSILTGKEIKGGLVKLIFGTIRLELTKILNMKGV